MNKNKRNQLQYLRFWIIIVMVVVFFFHPTFAADCNEDTNGTLTTIYEFLWNLWRFFSWIWIVLSNFAGVLMTNTMVYWEFMWLDTSLWNVWQISRSMANYALWFMFLYKVFKYIFFPWEKSPISKIKDYLIASVLIQASWFMVMVLLDLSTIVLATVSSFPSQVIDSSPVVMTAVQEQIAKNSLLWKDKTTVVVNAFTDEYLKWDNTKWFNVEPSTSWDGNVTPEKTTLDNLLPQVYNLWGTFLYLWFTAMKAQDYVVKPMPTASSCEDKVTKVITGLILDSWLIILYSLALVMLIVLLVMRLAYLWVFIAISPIVVLLTIFKEIKIDWKNDILDLKKAIFLIFQPVIFAFWMGLMFLFIVMIQNVFSQSAESGLWTSITASETKKSSSLTDPIPKIDSSLENSWVVGFHIKEWAKSLKDIILSIITLVLMWQFIKIALTWTMWSFNSNSSIARKMNNLVTKTWELFWTVWVVPTPEWMMWFNQVWDWYNSELLNRSVWKIENAFTSRDKSEQEIYRLLWKPNVHIIKSINGTQISSLEKSINNTTSPEAFIGALKSIREANAWLKYPEIIRFVDAWFKKYKAPEYNESSKEYKYMTDCFTESLWDRIYKGQYTSIEQIFKDTNNISSSILDPWFKKFYQEVLWWDKKSAPESFSEFRRRGGWEWRIEYTKPSSS